MFADHQPVLRDTAPQPTVAAGVDDVRASADDGQGGTCARKGAFVGSAVDAGGQPRHHSDACMAEHAGELPRMGQALRRGLPAAHHRHRRPLQEFLPPLQKQHQGRVPAMQQGLRVAGIAQHQHLAGRVSGQPVQCELQPDAGLWVRRRQGLRSSGAGCSGPLTGSSPQHGLRGTQGPQQAARHRPRHAWPRQQAEPGLEILRWHVAAPGPVRRKPPAARPAPLRAG